MSMTVDARGLSCPQPVIMTMNAMKKADTDELVVLVDTDTSRENVCRAAKAKGWEEADVAREDEGYRITLRKVS